ncbi:MAG: hypothetical protein EAX86_09855 [Candidatus Heimdallarchaeota archaeon]|nr:hypothetical protein [Candidatus Heimdallarchaeota archaeon]
MSYSDTESKEKRINEHVRSLILQSKEKITRNLQVETGRILDTRIKKIEIFNGAGGKTYVIEAALFTALAGEIDGGVVLKFAKNLENEVENANLLSKILIRRQNDWENWKKNNEIPKSIRKYPDVVFAPEVIHVISEVNTLILEFLSGFIPLLQVFTEPPERWGYAGYALARLHGHERQKVNLQLYSPLFNLLQNTIDQKFLDYWTQVLETSLGGVDFIHGDSHLSNILVSPMRIAWIDAMMLPRLDRMDDIGYILSHAIQEFVAININYRYDETDFLNTITRSWVPLILTTYKNTYDISQLYTRLPLDFFIGTHLIIRAELWELEIAKALKRLGQRFIYEMPISNLIQS